MCFLRHLERATGTRCCLRIRPVLPPEVANGNGPTLDRRLPKSGRRRLKEIGVLLPSQEVKSHGFPLFKLP